MQTNILHISGKHISESKRYFYVKTEMLADFQICISIPLNKLSDTVKNDVVKKGVYNAKIKNIEEKITDILSY